MRKKLAEKTQETKEQERVADSELIHKSYAYQQKQKKISMTPEEKRKDDEQAMEQVLKWYARYQDLSPQEQKRQNEIQDLVLAEELEQFRIWLNSEERKKFDLKYAEYEADRFETAK